MKNPSSSSNCMVWTFVILLVSTVHFHHWNIN
jgi:hypothetical protein